MPSSRWKQDPEVRELIDHFEEPGREWSNLTPSEYTTILKELDRCRKDFIYAARNYFWITTKRREEILFTLWPGQELILQKILELKGRGIPQKVFIVKGRQLGCSTLIEALIAWRTMFFSGVNALVVSYDKEHTANVLYPIMQFIYDRMPWWLKPECSSRKADTGMFFENPNPDLRRADPGLNSRIYVKGATSTTGVGQGIRLNAVHGSEVCDYPDDIFQDIVEEDMKNALAEDDPDTFAILESTAKGANRFAHHLWKRMVYLAEEAEWFPLFLPSFFEASRVRSIPAGWRLAKEEARMREQVEHEWVRCNNPKCLQYHTRFLKGEDRSGTTCVTCNDGVVNAYMMTDQQLAYMEHRRVNAERDDEALKRLRQELCITAEEAFQVSGYQIFGVYSQEFAASSVRSPLAVGDFDTHGKFHGCNTKRTKVRAYSGIWYYPCYQEDCLADHTHDVAPLQIWEWPSSSCEYAVGADIAEGLGGRADFSVGAVIRVSYAGGGDYQVATWRSNTIGPIQFAAKLAFLGRFYNECMVAPECNKYDIVLGQMRNIYNYGNLYRWKHLDSINMLSSKLGWYTNMASRPRLWQTLRQWLNQELFYIRSSNAVEEMKNFVKDELESVYAGGDKDSHDDELIALMIALYTAHEVDYNDNLGLVVPKREITTENAKFKLHCENCKHDWGENSLPDKVTDPDEFVPEMDPAKHVSQSGGLRCPVCGSRLLSINRNVEAIQAPLSTLEDEVWNEAMREWNPSQEWGPQLSWTDEHI